MWKVWVPAPCHHRVPQAQLGNHPLSESQRWAGLIRVTRTLRGLGGDVGNGPQSVCLPQQESSIKSGGWSDSYGGLGTCLACGSPRLEPWIPSGPPNTPGVIAEHGPQSSSTTGCDPQRKQNQRKSRMLPGPSLLGRHALGGGPPGSAVSSTGLSYMEQPACTQPSAVRGRSALGWRHQPCSP